LPSSSQDLPSSSQDLPSSSSSAAARAAASPPADATHGWLTAVKKLRNRDGRDFGWGIAHAAVTRRPPNFPLHDGTPYRGLHVRRWGLSFVHRSRTISCRAEPNFRLTIRSFLIAAWVVVGRRTRRRLAAPLFVRRQHVVRHLRRRRERVSNRLGPPSFTTRADGKVLCCRFRPVLAGARLRPHQPKKELRFSPNTGLLSETGTGRAQAVATKVFPTALLTTSPWTDANSITCCLQPPSTRNPNLRLLPRTKNS
jgi:hypothetical protein